MDKVEKKINHDQVIVHAKNASFKIINPIYKDSIISGVPELIPDTNSWIFKHSVRYAMESNVYPLEFYSPQSINITNNGEKPKLPEYVSIKPNDVTRIKLYTKHPETVEGTAAKVIGGGIGIGLSVTIMITLLTLLAWGIIKIIEDLKKCCFMKTAYQNDDAPELAILRKYRDEQLSKTSSGKYLTNAYYHISPVLIKLTNHKIGRKMSKYIADKMVAHIDRKYKYSENG